MVKRPTGSDGEPSSPNCGVSAGVKARHPFCFQFAAIGCCLGFLRSSTVSSFTLNLASKCKQNDRSIHVKSPLNMLPNQFAAQVKPILQRRPNSIIAISPQSIAHRYGNVAEPALVSYAADSAAFCKT